MRTFPEVRGHGLRALPAQPVLYLSEEGHPSFVKAVRACGLGEAAIRWIPVDNTLRLDGERLHAAITHDRSGGAAPFLIVATAGTTAAGVIDPLAVVADIAAAEDLWLHVDAAWGGGLRSCPSSGRCSPGSSVRTPSRSTRTSSSPCRSARGST